MHLTGALDIDFTMYVRISNRTETPVDGANAVVLAFYG